MSFPCPRYHDSYPYPQRMKGNEQTIESLAHRVKALAGLLRSPVSEDDAKEQQRRQTLER